MISKADFFSNAQTLFPVNTLKMESTLTQILNFNINTRYSYTALTIITDGHFITEALLGVLHINVQILIYPTTTIYIQLLPIGVLIII